MIPYTVQGLSDTRVLTLDVNASMRFKFKQLVENEYTPVKFKRVGSKLLAVVSDTVAVYKLPNAQAFHYEYMTQNARSLWLSVPIEEDRLLENMLEFVEVI